ncbi:MAG: hypothetical protein Q4C58_00235 [Eubacteriales bacterium]|nr:hypothetical protein [Eubacteriales bacterium]
MGGSKKSYDDDDGRTIADMSGIDRPGLFFPRKVGRLREHERESLAAKGAENPRGGGSLGMRPWEENASLNKDERRMYILGALKAALLIGLAFVVGLGLLVALLLFLWT